MLARHGGSRLIYGRHCLLLPKCIEHLCGKRDFMISSFRFRVSSNVFNAILQGSEVWNRFSDRFWSWSKREAPCCLRFTLTYFKGPIYNGQKQQEHRTIIVGMGKKNMEGNRAACVSREWSFGVHCSQCSSIYKLQHFTTIFPGDKHSNYAVWIVTKYAEKNTHNRHI